MTADTENLVLEHLRHIRARVDQIADDMTDLKLRMSGLESGMVVGKTGNHPRRRNRRPATNHHRPAGRTDRTD